MLCFCFVCLRLVYPMLSVTLDRPFLIATSVFSNVYFILLKYRYLNSSNELWFNTKPPVTLSSWKCLTVSMGWNYACILYSFIHWYEVRILITVCASHVLLDIIESYVSVLYFLSKCGHDKELLRCDIFGRQIWGEYFLKLIIKFLLLLHNMTSSLVFILYY